MTEENKYYTPELWEFCEGFELDFKNAYDFWQSWKINAKKGDIEWLLENHYPNRVRVKCLDHSDIERLGFEERGYFDTSYHFEKEGLFLTIGIEENPIVTLEHFNQVFYHGKVRNKYHLQQILRDIQC